MNHYNVLRDYYKDCFSFVDKFHFNSEVTQIVFKKKVSIKDGIILPISHSGIKDNRRKKNFKQDLIHLAFIGNLTPYKGLPMLIKTLDTLYKDGFRNWELDVWSANNKNGKGLPVYYKGVFSNEHLKDVYNDMDLLIVPSICNETFSLVTLEALSYGVPVLVSKTVGAKILVKEYNEDFIFTDESNLKYILKEIFSNIKLLINYNKKILDLPWNHSMVKHAKDIIEKLYK